jgi:glycerophosphoryl diester phosphodiesterase
LLNRKNLAEKGGINGYYPKQGVDGINMSATYLTKEIVDQAKKLGKTVGVWLERKDTKETKELYDLVFGSKVDFVFLDAPLPGMQFRD